jgi:uncharacterized membrane protein YeaQ/YmgE (transglycosylase-associated protein family)
MALVGTRLVALVTDSLLEGECLDVMLGIVGALVAIEVKRTAKH